MLMISRVWRLEISEFCLLESISNMKTEVLKATDTLEEDLGRAIGNYCINRL